MASGDEDITDIATDTDKLTGSAGRDWFILDMMNDKITDLAKDMNLDQDRITNTL